MEEKTATEIDLRDTAEKEEAREDLASRESAKWLQRALRCLIHRKMVHVSLHLLILFITPTLLNSR